MSLGSVTSTGRGCYGNRECAARRPGADTLAFKLRVRQQAERGGKFTEFGSLPKCTGRKLVGTALDVKVRPRPRRESAEIRNCSLGHVLPVEEEVRFDGRGESTPAEAPAQPVARIARCSRSQSRWNLSFASSPGMSAATVSFLKRSGEAKVRSGSRSFQEPDMTIVRSGVFALLLALAACVWVQPSLADTVPVPAPLPSLPAGGQIPPPGPSGYRDRSAYVGLDSSCIKSCPTEGCRLEGYSGSAFIRGSVGAYVGAQFSVSYSVEDFLSKDLDQLWNFDNLSASGGVAYGVWGASIEGGLGLQFKACCKF